MPESRPLDELIGADPQAQRQVVAHWLSLAVSTLGMLAVTVVATMHLLAEPATDRDAMLVPGGLLIVHGLACMAALYWHSGQVRLLRRPAANGDDGRLRQVITYLQRRRTVLLSLALIGQAVVAVAAFYGLNFEHAPWLLLALVPSFLLLSIGLRQVPSCRRLADHVRRLRLVQQDDL